MSFKFPFYYQRGPFKPVQPGEPGHNIVFWKDARYYVLLFLFSFAFAGQRFLGFYQRWDSLIVSICATMLVELILVRVLYKKWSFPLSALISGIGIGLLLSSYALWPYALAAVLAIVCKHALRLGGSHIFNPNNIALVVVLTFIPQFVVSTPKQWTNSWDVMAFILILGFIASAMAKRLDTVVAFVSGFAFFALLRHTLFGEPMYYAFGPLVGASFQLFAFFMITDPKTTPQARWARITAALLIALVDAVLRVQGVTNSPFYAAFVVTICFGLPYRWLMLRRSNTLKGEATG